MVKIFCERYALIVSPYLIIFGIILMSLCGCSCSRTIYVPVGHSVSDSLKNIRHHADTVIERDSIMMTVCGDTTVREVYRWRERIKHRVDTLYRTRVDSVRVIIPQSDCNSKNERPKLTERLSGLVTNLTWLLLILLLIRFLSYRKQR